jgi:hypothetical protein
MANGSLNQAAVVTASLSNHPVPLPGRVGNILSVDHVGERTRKDLAVCAVVAHQFQPLACGPVATVRLEIWYTRLIVY